MSKSFDSIFVLPLTVKTAFSLACTWYISHVYYIQHTDQSPFIVRNVKETPQLVKFTQCLNLEHK